LRARTWSIGESLNAEDAEEAEGAEEEEEGDGLW
jgi:hypothetical protein